jgi:hypothetical protein
MKQVAEERKVCFIDLQLKSELLVLAAGRENSKKLYLWPRPGEYKMYPEGKKDNTHLSVKGATEIAKLAVKGLVENDIGIAQYIIVKE